MFANSDKQDSVREGGLVAIAAPVSSYLDGFLQRSVQALRQSVSKSASQGGTSVTGWKNTPSGKNID